jgi:hypothetical protein
MIATAGVLLALLVYLRWRVRINRALGCVGRWIDKIVKDPKTYKVAETFCNEVAVLWFVFPLLDAIYDPTKRGHPFLAPAFMVSGLFLFFAVVLSHSAKEGKEE